MASQPLPIDPLLPEAIARLRESGRLVLEAPPGAGKTTRVPPAVLAAGLAGEREIVVLQPRRLAARLAARRVAEEAGEEVGQRIGYQVRFESVSGPRTRIRYVTEGILSRRLLSDPTLEGVGVVVLDEFHERHLAGDVALAMLRRLQQGPRPDLRLVVMSATLDADPVVRFLGDCPRIQSRGRAFEVAIEHLPQPDDRPLETQVAKAVRRLVGAGLDGHVLVFLPGAREIRRTREACEETAAREGIDLVPLHGDLPAREQDRAVRRSERRRAILSTNVAETSVTIEGVAAVVDSGLARIPSHSPWSGLPTLRVSKVSRASAAQRAGRAGRTREGRCLRLYTRHDHDVRPAHQVPEIRRLDLAETVLELRGAGVADPAAFEWLEAPDPAALEAADALLARLGAIDAKGAVTETGRRMLRYPLHPRLARLMVEATSRGVGEQGAAVAAVLGERDLRLSGRARGLRGGGPRGIDDATGPSDVLAAVEALDEARSLRFDPRRLRERGIDPGAARAAERAREQIARLGRTEGGNRTPSDRDPEVPLLVSILAAYPDRVARRRRARSPEVLLCGGGAAVLGDGSVVREAEMIVAVDAEERRKGSVLVRMASAVEPDWLLDLFGDRIHEEVLVTWNADAERVESAQRMLYDDLVLDEDRRTPADPTEVTRVLEEAALAAGPRAFVDSGALDRLRARVSLVATHFPDAGPPALGEADVRAALSELCTGRRSFAELREDGLLSMLQARLSPAQRRLLDVEAPERVRLHPDRTARVAYALGQPPWIASFLQDFFGLGAGPTLCRGRVPVVLHLLAPNRRAVQVTTDLAGFWTRHYPGIRKELARRYPRHAWPEDPRTASPPRRRKRK